MWADVKLMLSQITIPAEQLEIIFRPSEPFQLSVEGASASRVAQYSTRNMVDCKESPVGFPTANAPATVGDDHLLSDNRDCLSLVFGSLFEARGASTQAVVIRQRIAAGLATMFACAFLSQGAVALVQFIPAVRAAFKVAVACAATRQAKTFTLVTCNQSAMGLGLFFCVGAHVPIVPQVIG